MELAIPLIALGSLYVVSNRPSNIGSITKGEKSSRRKSNQEHFTNMGKRANYLPNADIPVSNYPITNANELANDTVQRYANPNAATDKYFDQNMYESLRGKKQGNDIQDVFSLSGNYMDTAEFKHNNMVPFYGGKIKGQVYGMDTAETILDNLNGSGSQINKKIEQAPLFKPEDNVQWAHGAPNNSDFFQSRVNPGVYNNNVKPFESVHVGPGLKQGYTTEGSGGFNSGMNARDDWLPKTVDELRVATNPKLEYSLDDHEGPAYANVQNSGIIGKVEKYLPDKFFIQTQDRWLTTTGQEKGQMLHSIQEVNNTHRAQITQAYTGVASEKNATYVKGKFEDPKREALANSDVNHSCAVGHGPHNGNDNAMNSHTNYVNNRSSVSQPDTLRSGFSRAIGSVIAPVLDIFRPTRKQEYTSNLRIYGDAGTIVPKSYILDSCEKTPTTIKETTLFAPRFNIGNQKDGAYGVTDQQPIFNQRDSTNVSSMGNMGGAGSHWGPVDYVGAYGQTNNESKEKSVVSRINHGNTQIFNETMNVNIAKVDNDRDNRRMWVPTNMPQQAVSVETYGQLIKPSYPTQNVSDRISPDLLNAFKSNPYTQSLNSVA